ncbi:UNVERIFIED_CONTAM: zinc finger protein [Trichonephila clavipes]
MMENCISTENRNLEISGDEKVLKCPKCYRTFSFEAHLRCHFHKMHPEFRLTSCFLPTFPKCDMCRESFSSEQKLKEHGCLRVLTTKVMSEIPYKCAECGKCFNLQNDFLKHYIMIYVSDKIYECKDCKKEFTSKQCYFSHVHRQKNKIGDSNCNSNSANKNHQEECLQKKSKSLKCEVCNKTVVNLKSHVLAHAEELCYQCDICNEYFTQKYSLRQHYRRHTNEKRFTCEICNARYATKGSLSSHYLKHTQEKPHVCDICYAAFKYKSSLEVHHSRTHTPKFYVCKVCNKRRSHVAQPVWWLMLGSSFVIKSVFGEIVESGASPPNFQKLLIWRVFACCVSELQPHHNTQGQSTKFKMEEGKSLRNSI